MNKDFIAKRIDQKFGSKTNFAKSLGIQLGSVTDWFQRGVIPSARLEEVFAKLDIATEEETEEALNLPKIEMCYRAAKKDISERELSSIVQENTKKFAKIFFGLKGQEKTSADINEMRIKINGNREPETVASIVRTFLDLTDRTPFNLDSVNYSLEKFGINVYFVPFKSFQFNSNEKINPLALTAHKNNQYLVLCDSARTWDEAFFDLTHELVHIFTGLVGIPRDDETEAFIDLVAEELIYPRQFLEREFPFLLDKDVKPTEKLFLDHNFRKIVTSSVFMAPRGIAKRLKTLGCFTDRAEVYKWMHNVEHDAYLYSYGSSVSTAGKMDFDFTDAYEFEEFIEKTVRLNPSRYPLFYELIKSLCDGRLTVRAFGEIFGLDSGEVDELRLKWIKEFSSPESKN